MWIRFALPYLLAAQKPIRNTLAALILVLSLGSCSLQAQPHAEVMDIYAFKVAGLMGDSIDFAQFRGKKILIVNTASECGYTPQYKGLEELYRQYRDQLVIVGFPSHDFGGQEPGTAEEIAEFCQKNYGVSFPMAAKVKIKGNQASPLFVWLSEQGKSIGCPSKVRWNFHKFLLDEQGKLIACFPSKTEPLSTEIQEAIRP